MAIIALCAFDGGKNNQVLFARMFTNISRTKANATVHAFPKLLSLNTADVPFIQSENIRYIFSLQYGIYFVVITDDGPDTNNNICNDSLLPLLAKLTLRVCLPAITLRALSVANVVTLTADVITEHIYELFIALDELVLYRGHISDWNLTLEQIETNLLMDSHEEHRYKLLQSGKMQEAKAKARQKAMEIDHARKVAHHTGQAMESTSNGILSDRIVGMGSSSAFNNSQDISGHGDTDYSGRHSTTQDDFSEPKITITQYKSLQTENLAPTFDQTAPAAPSFTSSVHTQKTMGTKSLGRKLGGSKTTLKKATITEDESVSLQQQQQQHQPQQRHAEPQPVQQSQLTTPTAATNTTTHPLSTLVEEKISILVDTNNTIKQLSCVGKLHITTTADLSIANPIIQLSNRGDYGQDQQQLAVFHTDQARSISIIKSSLRPGMDKTLWTQSNCLALNDITKPLQINNKNTVLQWKLALNQSTPNIALISSYFIPIHTTFWAQNNNDSTTIQVECTVNEMYTNNHFSPALNNVVLSIPCPCSPTSINGLNLPVHYDAERFLLHIQLGSINTAANANIFNEHLTHNVFSGVSFELEIQGGYDQEQFSPLHITMSPTQSIIGYNPIKAYNPETSEEIPLGTSFAITVDDFAIDL